MVEIINKVKNAYNRDDGGVWAAMKVVPEEGWSLVRENKGRTALVIAAVSLTAAYFVFPAYAAYVSVYTAKAVSFTAPVISGISGGFAAMFMFAAAHPLAAGLVAVAAVLMIGALARKNISQGAKIEVYEKMDSVAVNAIHKVDRVLRQAYEFDKDARQYKIKDDQDPSTVLDNVRRDIIVAESALQI